MEGRTLTWCSQGSTEWNPANQFWKYGHAPAALEQQHFARELIRTRGGFHASALWISGFGGTQEWFLLWTNKDGMHPRHNQSYVCGIWCRDINSLAGLQECNFFPHWSPKCNAQETAIYTISSPRWRPALACGCGTPDSLPGQRRHSVGRTDTNMTHATLHTLQLFLWSACK